METVIRLHPSELDLNLLNKIQLFIGKKKNVDVVISICEYDPNYLESLDNSIRESEQNTISMTMEEFLEYTPSIK